MVLPVEVSVISINQVPEIIEEIYGKLNLVMPSGILKITYIIGVVGTREHAQLILSVVEDTISEIKNLNVIITEAEERFEEAEDAFNVGDYAKAEESALEAKDLAIQINQTASEALERMNEAEKAILRAANEGRTVGLDQSKTLFDRSRSKPNTNMKTATIQLPLHYRIKPTQRMKSPPNHTRTTKLLP